MKEINSKAKEFYEFIMPAVDIYDDGNELVILIDLPGFDKKDINLKIIKNILSIKANRSLENILGTVYYAHRPTTIDKKVVLPFEVKDESVLGSATYTNGVVTIKIPIDNTGNISII